MGNAPRTNNPYAVTGGSGLEGTGGQPPPPAKDAYSTLQQASQPAPLPFTMGAPAGRDAMATQMAAKPPAPATLGGAFGGFTTAATAPAAAAVKPATAPAVKPATAPAVKPATAPAAATPAAPRAAAVAPKAVTAPAAPVGTAVYTPPKAVAPPKVTAAAAPKSTQTVIPANLKANPGSPWTPAQVAAGGRWELPAGAPAGALGRNFVKYTAPVAPVTPPAVNNGRDALAHAVAMSASNNGVYYPNRDFWTGAGRGGAWAEGGRSGGNSGGSSGGYS